MGLRTSGVLLHVTSLPSRFGVGDLGKGALLFADFLRKSKQSIWQILPLNPSSAACGYSPYCSYSAFAGNPTLISPESLVEDGFLLNSDMDNCPAFEEGTVDYPAASIYKEALLRLAFERYRAMRGRGEDSEFEKFCEDSGAWLDDYALFVCLKTYFKGVAWNEWPVDLRDRHPDSLKEWSNKLEDAIYFEKFTQFVFFRQWFDLKRRLYDYGIRVIGDIPIYVSFDSSDVWANPEVFDLNEHKQPRFVAGVPPDYFSPTGQRWGNPVYHWEALRRDGFQWWLKRMEHNFRTFDTVRLDHFRGFVGYWEIPAHESTAVNGRWVEAPARDFFDTLLRRYTHLPIIAEDLGIITPDVREIMDRYGFPGMKLLHFAFGDDLPANPYVPHNVKPNSVIYTGTHDNNTTRGWFLRDATEREKDNLFRYIGRVVGEDRIHWELIRLAMMSVADTVVIPLQDFLGCGEEARMNTPSTVHGNWGWRVGPDKLSDDVAQVVAEMTYTYGRG